MADATISHNFGSKRNYREPSIWADWSIKGKSIPSEVEGTSRYVKSKNGETAKLILTYYFILKLLVKQCSWKKFISRISLLLGNSAINRTIPEG